MNSKSSNNLAGGLIPQILSSFTALSDKNAILERDTTSFLRPWLTGTAEPNSIVNVQVNAQPIGQVTSDKTGQWTFELPLQANGEQVFTVSSTETGATSAPFTISLNSERQLNTDPNRYSLENEPLLPMPDVLYSESKLNSVPQVFKSTQNPFVSDTQTITSPATNVETITSTAAVTQSVTFDTQSRTDTVQTRNIGNMHDAGKLFSTTLAGEEEAWKLITAAQDMLVTISRAKANVGQEQNLYGSASETTDNARPTFTGRAGESQIVTLFSGSTSMGSTVSDAYGNWSLEVTRDLVPGVNNVEAKAGNQTSNAFYVNYEPAETAPLTIIAAEHNGGHFIQKVITGGETYDPKPALYGKAGADVVVYLNEGDYLLGSAVTNSLGYWTIQLENTLTPGQHEFVVTSKVQQSQPFELHVKQVGSGVLVIDLAIDGEAIGEYATVVDKIEDKHPLVLGKAEAESIVTLYDGTSIIGSTTANSYGFWKFQPAFPLSEGLHSIKASNGELISEALEFTIVPNLTEINYIADREEQGSVIDIPRPFLNGIAPINSQVEIYDNGKLIGNTFSLLKQWHFRPAQDLTPGEHIFTVKGNGVESDPFKVTIAAPSTSSLLCNDLLMDAPDDLFTVTATPEDAAPQLIITEEQFMQESHYGLQAVTTRCSEYNLNDELIKDNNTDYLL